MKSISIAVILSMISVFSLMAQPSMGRGGGGPSGRGQGGGGGPRGGEQRPQYQQEEQVIILHLPQIPDLTEKQREKLVKNISDERKDLRKLMRQKRQLEAECNNPENNIAPKKKLQKIDTKIEKAIAKYDKKNRQILTPEQYIVFLEKKEEIEFAQPQRRNRENNRPSGERRQPRDQRQNEDDSLLAPPQNAPGGWNGGDEF